MYMYMYTHMYIYIYILVLLERLEHVGVSKTGLGKTGIMDVRDTSRKPQANEHASK